MTNAILRGMPDAENPHARFEGGEVASAATPRRGSLLYKKITAVFCAVLALVLTAVAETYTVYPDVRDGMTGPQQFTNCMHRIANGDTIIVKPGTYDFTGIYDPDSSDAGRSHVSRAHSPIPNFSVIGETTGHWDDAIVFKGDVRFGCFTYESMATLYKGAAPYFANITFDGFTAEAKDSNNFSGGALKFSLPIKMGTWGYPTLTNCVFKNNSAPGRGGAVFGGMKAYDCKFVGNSVTGAASAGAVAGYCGLVDCVFDGNTSPNNAGAVTHTMYPISNCTFRANVCQNNGAAIWGDNASLGEIVGCHFLTNSAKYNGGAVFFSDKGVPLVTNCTFSGNSSVSGSGGAVYSASTPSSGIEGLFACHFEGNDARSYGGAINGGYAYGCTFEGSKCSLDYMPGWDAFGARLEKCDLRTGGVVGCSLNACTLKADTGAAYGVFQLHGEWAIAATNCLIVGTCTNSLRGIVYAYKPANASTFVNCTFADITLKDGGNRCLIYVSSTVTACPIEFKNCVFSNIRQENGTGFDLSYYNDGANTGVSFQNCCYGTMQDGFNMVDVGGTFQCDNPRFEGDGDYTPMLRSPLRGKGALLGWTAADTDIVGNPRLRDGMIDIGCYQCWLAQPGFIISFR